MGGMLTKSSVNINHNEIDHLMVRHLDNPFYFQMEPLWRRRYSRISSSMDSLKEFGITPYGKRRTSSVSNISRPSQGKNNINSLSLCDLRELEQINDPMKDYTMKKLLENQEMDTKEIEEVRASIPIEKDINSLVDNLKVLKKRVKRYDGTENPQEIKEELVACSENLNQIQSENKMLVEIRSKMNKRIRNYLEILAEKVERHREERISRRLSRRKSGPKEDPFEYELGKLKEVDVKLDQICQGLSYYYRSVDEDEYVNIKNALGDCALILRDIDTKGNINVLLEKEACEDRLFDYQKQLEIVKENAGRRQSYMLALEESNEEEASEEEVNIEDEEIQFIDDKSSYYSRATSADTDDEFFDCYEDITLSSPSTPIGMYEQPKENVYNRNNDFSEKNGSNGNNNFETPTIVVTEVKNVDITEDRNLCFGVESERSKGDDFKNLCIEETKKNIRKPEAVLLDVTKPTEIKVNSRIRDSDKDDIKITHLIKTFQNKTEIINKPKETVKIYESENVSRVENNKRVDERNEQYQHNASQVEYATEEELKALSKNDKNVDVILQSEYSQVEYATLLNDSKKRSKDENVCNIIEKDNIYENVDEENIYEEIVYKESDQYHYPLVNVNEENDYFQQIESRSRELDEDRIEARNKLLIGYGLECNSYDKYTKIAMDKSKQIAENLYEYPNDFISDFIGIENTLHSNENYNELVSKRKQQSLNEEKTERKKNKEHIKQRKYESVISLSPIKEVFDAEELPPELKPKPNDLMEKPFVTSKKFKISYAAPKILNKSASVSGQTKYVENLRPLEIEHLEAKTDTNIQSKTLFEIYNDHLIPSILRNEKKDIQILDDAKPKLTKTQHSSFDTKSNPLFINSDDNCLKSEQLEYINSSPNKYPNIIRPKTPPPRTPIDPKIYENILESIENVAINEESPNQIQDISPTYVNVNIHSEATNVEKLMNENNKIKKENVSSRHIENMKINQSESDQLIYENFSDCTITKPKKDLLFEINIPNETVLTKSEIKETLNNIFSNPRIENFTKDQNDSFNVTKPKVDFLFEVDVSKETALRKPKEKETLNNIFSKPQLANSPAIHKSLQDDLSLEARDVLTELPSTKSKLSLIPTIDTVKETNEDIVLIPLNPIIPGRNVSDEEEEEIPNEMRMALKSVMECVENMKECVDEFEGSKTDSEYISIFENLMNSMTILNGFRADDSETIEYKQSILMEIIKCMKVLEDKVQ